MSRVISIHSFRGGTGKSNTTANLTSLLAQMGYRVGVVDTDIQSPGIHVIFGLTEDDIGYSLNDYLGGKCPIEESAYDVTANLGAEVDGRVFLIPSSLKAGEIARVIRDGYDVGMLSDGFWDLVDHLKLDALLIDTHPGLNEETLLSIAISDALVILLRPDQQDYQGTSVTVEVARRLDIPQLLLVVNKLPAVYDADEVREKVENAYQAEVAAILPHSDTLMALGSADVFALRYPDHPITQALTEVAQRLMSGE
ncbi:MAG: MinD/ParA family protein [Chloroflexota bacterium]|jgi:MinD-like ATPase involved in chromosome partitioning or flagellar assembly